MPTVPPTPEHVTAPAAVQQAPEQRTENIVSHTAQFDKDLVAKIPEAQRSPNDHSQENPDELKHLYQDVLQIRTHHDEIGFKEDPTDLPHNQPPQQPVHRMIARGLVDFVPRLLGKTAAIMGQSVKEVEVGLQRGTPPKEAPSIVFLEMEKQKAAALNQTIPEPKTEKQAAPQTPALAPEPQMVAQTEASATDVAPAAPAPEAQEQLQQTPVVQAESVQPPATAVEVPDITTDRELPPLPAPPQPVAETTPVQSAQPPAAESAPQSEPGNVPSNVIPLPTAQGSPTQEQQSQPTSTPQQPPQQLAA